MANQGFSLMKRQKCQHKGPRLVKTYFNQPGKAARRHRARILKAQKSTSPIQKLRPIVHCCSLNYNMKIREGKGFSIAEIQKAGLEIHKARRIGIAVDTRRINKSQDSIDRNVERLQKYLKRVEVLGKDVKRSQLNSIIIDKEFHVATPKPQIQIGNVADFTKEKLDVYKTLHALRVERLKKRRTPKEKAAKK